MAWVSDVVKTFRFWTEHRSSEGWWRGTSWLFVVQTIQDSGTSDAVSAGHWQGMAWCSLPCLIWQLSCASPTTAVFTDYNWFTMPTGWLFLDSMEWCSPSHTMTCCLLSMELRDGSQTLLKQCTTIIYLCSIRYCRWSTCYIIREVCYCVQTNWPWFEDWQTRQASWQGDVVNRNESYGDVQRWNGSGHVNRARGEIIKIVLDENKSNYSPTWIQLIIQLKYPPAYVLIRMKSSKVSGLEGLEQNIIPSMLMEHTFLITQGSQSRTVVHKQPPLTTAYTFTDYWLQEQTIQNAIIDIASPPMGTLTPFNIYVALSWSRGHEGIRLLHNFDEKLLIMHPSEISRAEDERLTRINKETKN